MTPPPRWKLAILTWIGVYPSITVLLVVLGPFLFELPIPVVTLVLSVTLVALLSFVIMPLLTRVFRPWLTRRAPTADADRD
ncbi:antibiotic biosynthesis monooxygenase (ABM) superfamily enzyme [Microbacteriaceae bacterium SG_E_30_P1]|uniref:Antibiotic biosynthesis monooxygenase (ABM) superfamily enzyme n=1 Tax=Antiquaquibacter oligotrophicus TaxID=2880260 RepID=A0ABT6KQM9_9MICO|nr:hypothetical protein [Antiquaquibacter oligotrophicus]MDH6182281.1 antibiotic biosynthesis monooxygenase (ABM) superfamily enzyme [Antiquaquibacter oligotrophicus]UDF12062.1 hypothetical protein LH407_07745 [Antiquaquibacter oligotrophicus]